ncbi:MAG TPA: hypothetical protein VMT69_01325 [Kineosporiaceae bacterium]|nr:hypothetical protein [Kineosporiaceae bacterium]
MSITSLTGVALARNQPGTTTKADSGEVPKDAPGADEQASLLALLVKQVPTGMVAAYTAVTAALAELAKPTAADPRPDHLLAYRWAILAILVVGSVTLSYVSYRGKADPDDRRYPVAEMIGVGVAASGWGLALPDSPLLAAMEGPQGVATVFLVGFVATVINVIVAQRLQSPATPVRASRALTAQDVG